MSDMTPSSPISPSVSYRRDKQSSLEESAPDPPAVLKGLYRVATPELRSRYSLVSATHELDNQVGQETMEEIKAIAFQVLKTHQGVQPPSREYKYFQASQDSDSHNTGSDLDPKKDDHVLVDYQGYLDDEDSFRLTVQIVAEWDDHTSPLAWEEAARDIKKAIDEHFRVERVHVEIIATCLCRKIDVGPVLGEPGLEAAWEHDILPQITSILQGHQSTSEYISAIILCRMGYELDQPLQNPITVFIALDPSSDEQTWPRIAYQLKQYLNGLRYPMELKMEHNCCWS